MNNGVNWINHENTHEKDIEFLGLKKEPLIITEGIRQCIEYILGNEHTGLSEKLIFLESNGSIELSDNPINNFPVETEIKILDVNHAEIINKLLLIGAKHTFSGIVEDVYYDYEDLNLDKEDKSFRIRKKTDIKGDHKFYYTIKRKDGKKRKDTGLRFSYERELLVNKPERFFINLLDEGLRRSRDKIKYRTSFFMPLNGDMIKFDLDYYIDVDGKIPQLLEIEISQDDKNMLDSILNNLGLEKNELTTKGSRGTFKRYGIEQNKYYKRSNGNIIWNK